MKESQVHGDQEAPKVLFPIYFLDHNVENLASESLQLRHELAFDIEEVSECDGTVFRSDSGVRQAYSPGQGHNGEGVQGDVCVGEGFDGEAGLLEPFQVVVLTLAGYDDIFEQREELGGDGEGVVVVEGVWWGTQDRAEGVAAVEEGGDFEVDLLADIDDVIAAVHLVLYNRPVRLEDDGSFVEQEIGVDSLSELKRETKNGRAVGTVGNDGFRGAFMRPWEESTGEASSLLQSELRTLSAFASDRSDWLGFCLAPGIVIVGLDAKEADEVAFNLYLIFEVAETGHRTGWLTTLARCK